MTALRKLLVLGFERLLLATRHGRIEGDSSWCRLVATNCGNDVIELPASDAGDTLFEDLSAFRRGNFGLTHDDELFPHATRLTAIAPAMPSRQVFISVVVILGSPSTGVRYELGYSQRVA